MPVPQPGYVWVPPPAGFESWGGSWQPAESLSFVGTNGHSNGSTAAPIGPPPPPPPRPGGLGGLVGDVWPFGGPGGPPPPPPQPPPAVTGAKCKAPPKPFCPAPKEPPPGQIKNLIISPPDWCGPDACTKMADIVAAWKDAAYKDFFHEFLGDDPSSTIYERTAGGKDLNFIEKTCMHVFAWVAGSILNLGTTVINFTSSFWPCDFGTQLVPGLASSAATWIERIVGWDLSIFRQPYQYAANFACPTKLPSQAETNLLFLTDLIRDDTWECWTKANGSCVEPQKEMIQAQRQRPDPLQTVQLWFRDRLSDDDYKERMRALGVLRDNEREDFEVLARYVPGPGDLVRFMLRDTFDKEVVDKYGYDLEFEDKWAGTLQDWTFAQGMDEGTMRMYWRAHWQLPSPGQGFEMVRRLRADNLPGGPADPLYTTADDIRELLRINDYAPFWIDRLLAISYNPLTRVDTRRAYAIGAIDADRVKASFLDQGYSDENADVLTQFTKKDRDNTWHGKVSPASPKHWFNAYANGYVSDDVALIGISQWNIDPDVAAPWLAEAELVKLERRQKEIYAAVKKRFMLGEMTTAQATTVLRNAGFDGPWIDEEVAHLQTLLSLKGKSITAAQLCKLHSRNLIDDDEYIRRLMRLGYTQSDAIMLAFACSKNLSEAKLCKLYKEHLITEGELLSRLKLLGYAEEDANMLMSECILQRYMDEQKEILKLLERLEKEARQAEKEAYARWLSGQKLLISKQRADCYCEHERCPKPPKG